MITVFDKQYHYYTFCYSRPTTTQLRAITKWWSSCNVFYDNHNRC